MSLMISILSVAGTLASGAPRLVAHSFNVASTSSYARDLCGLLDASDAYDLLDDASSVEIDRASLLALRIEPDLNMVNGEVNEGQSYGIGELVRAQEAARADDVRVMIEIGF